MLMLSPVYADLEHPLKYAHCILQDFRLGRHPDQQQSTSAGGEAGYLKGLASRRMGACSWESFASAKQRHSWNHQLCQSQGEPNPHLVSVDRTYILVGL